MSSALDAEAIDALLVEAFGAVPRPPRETLINRHCEECLETSEAFADKRWQDVTVDDIERGQAIQLLTPSAWRYYLPALIRWYVRDAEAADGWLQFLPSQLTPTKSEYFPGQRAYLAERHDGFDERQRAAIVAYLQWTVKREEALECDVEALRRALEFWSTAR